MKPFWSTAARTNKTAHGLLAPAANHPDRGAFLKWLFFASNTLHADLRILFYADKYIDAAQVEILRTGIRPRLRQHLRILDTEAKKAPGWLHSDQPSVLTYYIACQMRWMALYPTSVDRSWYQLADTPHLQKILMQLESRPATRAAVAAEGLGSTPFTSPIYANPPEGSAI
jgi:glutathione S-transferase